MEQKGVVPIYNAINNVRDNFVIEIVNSLASETTTKQIERRNGHIFMRLKKRIVKEDIQDN